MILSNMWNDALEGDEGIYGDGLNIDGAWWMRIECEYAI